MLKLVVLVVQDYDNYYEPVVKTYELDQFVPPDYLEVGYGVEETDENGKTVARIVNFWCDEKDLDKCRELFHSLKTLVEYVNAKCNENGR